MNILPYESYLDETQLITAQHNVGHGLMLWSECGEHTIGGIIS